MHRPTLIETPTHRWIWVGRVPLPLAVCRPVHLPTPPTRPREWVVELPVPDGVEIGDHESHDDMARDLAPRGYVLGGTIPVSLRSATRDEAALRDPRGWRIRVTYLPAAWARVLRAPVAVYAAAQIAGIVTTLDDVMCADHDGIQYRTSDGRPTRRECYDWSADLPSNVRRALGEIRYIDGRRRVGYMHARPDTGQAQIVADREADGDSTNYQIACERVRAWVREAHPTVEREG